MNPLIDKRKKIIGFTLVEVVVVIGIIGLLSSIIYSSFSGAKAKSRDQQRVADISTIQLALEMYFNKNKQYPISLDDLDALSFTIPTPPNNNDGYGYYYFPIKKYLGENDDSNTRCISYHLWTKLEAANSYLDSKKGFNSSSLPGEDTIASRRLLECGSGHPNIDANSDPLIYDVTP